MRIKTLNKRIVGLGLMGALLGSIEAGNLTGRVVLVGTPPPEIVVTATDLARDPRCAALHTEPLTTRHHVVGEEGGLANVVVYVKEGVPEGNHPIPVEKPLLDQVKCEYVPYVMGVRANQAFQIRNSDPTFHNVNATPARGSGNRPFNFSQPFQGRVDERTFTAPEVAIRFRCDLHPWMFAYVAVFDHPFFAVTDENGRFEIPGLPDGRYTLEVWHQRTHRAGPGKTREIEVKGDTKVEFEIEVRS
jgi:hypothetical protein